MIKKIWSMNTMQGTCKNCCTFLIPRKCGHKIRKNKNKCPFFAAIFEEPESWLISRFSQTFSYFLYIFFSVFEEPEDPTNRSFFSEIISSISDVKFSNSGRYMISRDYLSVKVWDLHMETKPIETYTVSNQIDFKFNCLRFF